VEGDRPLLNDYVELQTKDKVQVLQDAGCDPAKQLEIFDSVMDKPEGQRAVRRDHRLAEEVRRARRALGPRHLREPADGVQLLLRHQDPGQEGLTSPVAARDTIRPFRMVSFLRRLTGQAFQA
jgi:hypothetical protein